MCGVHTAADLRAQAARPVRDATAARRGAARRAGGDAARARQVRDRLYSGTLIYDRSKLRGFTARLYWPAPNAPATLAFHLPHFRLLPSLYDELLLEKCM